MLSAKAKVGQAQAAVEQAQANRKQVTIRTADAFSAEAAVIQVRANLEAAQLQLDYTTIVAPVEGVVTRKSVEVGQVVQPGQGLMMLIPLQDIWVTADFKETQLANVHRGQKAQVHVDMYGETFSGHVDSIAGATGARLSLLPPENATGNYVKVVQRIPVKIVLDPIPPDKAILRPGMNVDATVFTR
jgi:membrane fusion protein (multidrug efflux system)